tara:strand:- start:149 stop:349 length:201 start_codon:yes stop_codon:yes gene_type:complete
LAHAAVTDLFFLAIVVLTLNKNNVALNILGGDPPLVTVRPLDQGILTTAALGDTDSVLMLLISCSL